jgi:hypothetical protein
MSFLRKSLLLFVLLPFFTKAQTNYKPGYVIALNGDTVKGYVDYREWSVNPTQFTFKSNSGIQNYTPANCNGFGVTGFEYYQKAIVSVSKDKVSIQSLSTGIDTTSVIDTVFLNIVSKGKNVNLYILTDVTKDRFYISQANATPIELIRHIYIDADQQSKVVTQTLYKTQLRQLAYAYQPDNASLKSDINHADYDINDIRLIINKINGGDYIQLTTANTGGGRFFIGVGITNTKEEFKGETPFAGYGSVAAFPSFDFGFDLLRNKNVGSLFVRLELGFNGGKFQFTTSAASLSFSQYTGYLAPQVNYNFFNSQQLKVYAGAGVVVDLSTYSNKTYSNPSDQAGTYSPDLQALYLDAVGKIGVILNNEVDIQLRYMPPVYISNNIGYGIKSSQIGLGINYLFDR